MEDDTDLFISFSLDLTLMRFIGNVLVPSNLHINVGIDRGDTVDDHGIELALTKWRYFVDNIMSKSIVFCHENTQALDIVLDENSVNKTGNLFVLTPDEPSDEVIGAVIQAKFNALGEDALYATSLEVTSDNLHGLSFTLLGDHGSQLPSTVEQYLDVKSYWEKPWWHRNDASTIDVVKPDDAPEGVYPSWAYSMDFLDRSSKAKTQAIPTKPSFKPTIIDGGKTDPEKK
jgi:hypothetical protein